MAQEPSFFVLAYYHFTAIADPHQEVKAHKEFFKDRNITSRIYLSEQGINGQMSGKREDAEAYMNWLHANPLFETMPFKIHSYHENVFPRQTVKYRKQLVALDEDVDMNQTGQHISPLEWKELLEKEKRPLLLDVRNEYEWQVGRFDGAECPPCDTFREFKEYAENLKTQVNPEQTPIMMYCTGGIRCELYSSLLKKEGFKEVYQLEGGIINYGLKQGSEHWLGKLFVFDDRLTIPISQEPAPVIGSCHHCQTSNETYYNCANMDCNHLYLCCQTCVEKFLGCCCTDCQNAPRVRPYHHQDVHKPFRKRHHYFKDDLTSKQ
ncbi:oxygen-dependent tRNA uridine(34) hydroxylase TrhO [Candidatus Protochlamydia sp. W-9]|uniref:oxygen-dependent tRNA uridine(34) hydroxylase TrhO n=1 Tax=Candidatus Protochlamydia sp. W-9 TaxID=1785087 RepID=UPI00096AAA4F|nr:rhodanese-related sulfurtransferase [Candidatus Protochlamydia sp. W-9]